MNHESDHTKCVLPAWYTKLNSLPVVDKYREPFRSDPTWLPFFEAIDEKYKVANKILPKGTILYHGNLFKDGSVAEFRPSRESETPVVYFGLDFDISAWILTESWRNRKKENTTILFMERICPYLQISKTNEIHLH